MKTVIFTVCFFLLILCFVFINFAYINKTSERLCHLTQSLPDVDDETCQVRVDSLIDEWRSLRSLTELSTSLTRLQHIDNLLSSLKVFAAKQRDAEFEECRAHLLNTFSELREFESLNFFDIF